MNRGKFIVVEGVDGSGKSIVCTYLKSIISHSILEVEPTYAGAGKIIRSMLIGERTKIPVKLLAGLFAFDRYDHTDCIRDYLDQGLHVICDRYIWSSFAYQAKDATEAKWIEDLHQDWYLPPDHLIYLMVEPERAAERLVDRPGRSIFDNTETITHTKARYEEDLAYCRAFRPEMQLHIIEADGDIESVQAQLRCLVDNVFHL